MPATASSRKLTAWSLKASVMKQSSLNFQGLSSRLKSFCEEVLFLDKEFTATVQQLRGAIDKHLEIHPDLSVFPSSNKYNKSMWSCWADSLFEGAIERAEMFLESLEQIRAELAWMVSMFVGERKDVAPKIPRAEGWEDIGEHSAEVLSEIGFSDAEVERLTAAGGAVPPAAGSWARANL